MKKPRPNRDAELAELAALEPLLAALESGTPLADAAMNDEQLKVTRSFRLLTEKPKLVVFNVADDEADPERFVERTGRAACRGRSVAVPAGLELELARMSPEDRAAFREEMGIGQFDRDALSAHAAGRLGPDALLHGRRKRSPHLDAPPGRARRWKRPPTSTPTWPAASSAPKS